MIQVGDIILFRTKRKFWPPSLEWAIGFFTSSRRRNMPKAIREKLNGRLRHAALGIGLVPSNHWNMGTDSIMEADLVTTIRPWSHILAGSTDFKIYRLQGISTYLITEATRRSYERFAARQYAYLQLLWFIYRWLVEMIGGFDVRRQGNWFPNKEVCSEQPWWTLDDITDHSLEQPASRTLKDILHEWKSSNFHPVDLWEVCERSSVFKLVEERWDGQWRSYA